MRRNFTIFVFAILAITIVGFFFLKKEKFPYAISSSGIEITLKNSATPDNKNAVYHIHAGDVEGEAVLTKVANQEAGAALVNWNFVNVKSTYKNSIAPYAGQVTANVACESQKFLKEESVSFQGTNSKIILAIANNRRIFGSCLIDEVKNAAGIWSAYDPALNQVAAITLFKPVQNSSEILDAQQNILQIFRKIISP